MFITVHSVVINEDQYIAPALLSVLPYVDKVLIFDTGSTDRTVETIKSIKSSKIEFEQKGEVSAQQYVALRQEQIDRTKTDFFLLLDGDEVWPKKSIEQLLQTLKTMAKDKIAVICRTRNAVGDVYHYLPEEEGAYEFLGKRGHLSMRAFRNVPELAVAGSYPLETFKYKGRSLNGWDEKLEFSDTWYLHLTHLTRSSSPKKVPGFRIKKIHSGIKLDKNDLPEELVKISPPKRSLVYELAAATISPIRKLKRIYEKI